METTDGGKSRRVEAILESRVESADVAESLINTLAANEYGEKEIHEISLALREAMANAIRHGNAHSPHKRIFLRGELNAAGLVISIRDEGNGCEPDNVPDPREPENILRDSGRGLLLIRACMDEATWNLAPSGGTELVMMKRTPRAYRPKD